jgi:hypothetical protein
MGVQKHYKKRFAQKIVSKKWGKNGEKIKTDFFLIFYHIFRRFAVGGVQKHDKKISEKTNLTPVLFLASDPPILLVADVLLWRRAGRPRFLVLGRQKEEGEFTGLLSKKNDPPKPKASFFFADSQSQRPPKNSHLLTSPTPPPHTHTRRPVARGRYFAEPGMGSLIRATQVRL